MVSANSLGNHQFVHNDLQSGSNTVVLGSNTCNK